MTNGGYAEKRRKYRAFTDKKPPTVARADFPWPQKLPIV